MKNLSLFLASLFLVACEQGGPLGRPVDPVNPENPAEVEAAGAELYDIWCAECHGDEGEGSNDAFQIQNPIVNYATFVIRNGRDTFTFSDDMPAFDTDTLTDDEMNSIIYFLRQAEKPTNGAGLYARFCANCHGDNSNGGVVGVSAAEEAQDKPEEVLETVREGEGESAAQRFEYMPAFPAADLSNSEVNKITDFLLSL
jgi:mono/diheme cytochrome c family protein